MLQVELAYFGKDKFSLFYDYVKFEQLMIAVTNSEGRVVFRFRQRDIFSVPVQRQWVFLPQSVETYSMDLIADFRVSHVPWLDPGRYTVWVEFHDLPFSAGSNTITLEVKE
jgi:hypothetical protein